MFMVAEHIRLLSESCEKMRAALAKARAKEERRAARKASGDSDEEDEEDEEEEEGEEEGEKRIQLHPVEVQLYELSASIRELIHLLVSAPLDEQGFSRLAGNMWANSVVDVLGAAHDRAVESAGLADFVSRAIPIPTLPSPFTSAEGAEAWDRALKTTSPNPDPPTDKKAAKAPKNAPPPTAPTSQQVDYFYKEMYEFVRTGILEATERLFDENSSLYRQQAKVLQKQLPIQLATIRDLAVPRSEDYFGKVVFMSVDGDALVSDATTFSLFPLQLIALRRLVATLTELLTKEPKLVVLVTESPRTVASPSSMAEVVGRLQASLKESWAAYQHSDRRSRKKLKQPPREYREPDVFFSSTAAKLIYQLGNLLQTGSLDGMASSPEYFGTHAPIFVLENLQFDGVIPQEPDYISEESDEEEAPVYLGKDLARDYKYRKWVSHRPFSVPVAVLTEANEKVSQDCYCESYAAIRQILATAELAGDQAIWVDDSIRGVYDPASTFVHEKVCDDLQGKRMVAPSTREGFGWYAVLRSMNSFQALVADLSEEPLGVTKHLAALFPHCVRKGVAPMTTFVLGGEMRADKLRLLDEIIALVRLLARLDRHFDYV